MYSLTCSKTHFRNDVFFLFFMHGDIWTIWLKHFYHIGKHDSVCQHVWLSKNDFKMIMAIQPFFFTHYHAYMYIGRFFFKLRTKPERRNLSRTTLLVRSYVKYIRSCASPRCLTHADLYGGCSGRFFKPPPPAIKIIPRPTHFHPTPSPKKNSKSAHITCFFCFF